LQDNKLYQMYDIESYPNCFTFTGFNVWENKWFVFEISDRRNDAELLRQWLFYWADMGVIQVGFNNEAYDYIMIHYFMSNPAVNTGQQMRAKNDEIFNTSWDDKFKLMIWPDQRYLKQMDLFKIHHFDNANKRVSLKVLEFIMRMSNIQETPVSFDKNLTHEEIDMILEYNIHDVKATYQFFQESQDAITLRETMSEKMGQDCTNYNDPKIGEKYFINELEKAGVTCFRERKPLQTHRSEINLGDVIFDYVKFNRPEFNAVLNQLKNTTVYETKGALSGVSAVVDGFSFDFGLGGIHGSVEGEVFHECDDYVIYDWDVASYYPNLSIANRIFPAHLSEKFCDVYEDVYQQRKQHAKKTAMNLAMKLALNGVYGKSNSEYSCFFDSNFTMAITVNGQLLLCMLAEKLIETIPNLKMIQINTDGLTIKIPRGHVDMMNRITADWEKLTKLTLEFVQYKSMYVRDVNNYMAVGVNGYVKRNGAYNHEGLDWDKNHSALVVKKAANAAILDGANVREFIKNHDDLYDFFYLVKAPKSARLETFVDEKWGNDIVASDIKTGDTQNVSRYLVTNDGEKLIKVMNPIKRKGQKLKMVYFGWKGRKFNGCNKNLDVATEHEYNTALTMGYRPEDGDYTHTGERRSEVEAKKLVTVVNTVEVGVAYDINIEHYVEQAEKLVNALI